MINISKEKRVGFGLGATFLCDVDSGADRDGVTYPISERAVYEIELKTGVAAQIVTINHDGQIVCVTVREMNEMRATEVEAEWYQTFMRS